VNEAGCGPIWTDRRWRGSRAADPAALALLWHCTHHTPIFVVTSTEATGRPR
jgi:hypothetical protein